MSLFEFLNATLIICWRYFLYATEGLAQSIFFTSDNFYLFASRRCYFRQGFFSYQIAREVASSLLKLFDDATLPDNVESNAHPRALGQRMPLLALLSFTYLTVLPNGVSVGENRKIVPIYTLTN